jgi:hypothetical protein
MAPATRAIGIDPGTVSIDVCGLHDGEVVLDHAIPTAAALADPAARGARRARSPPPHSNAGP